MLHPIANLLKNTPKWRLYLLLACALLIISELMATEADAGSWMYHRSYFTDSPPGGPPTAAVPNLQTHWAYRPAIADTGTLCVAVTASTAPTCEAGRVAIRQSFVKIGLTFVVGDASGETGPRHFFIIGNSLFDIRDSIARSEGYAPKTSLRPQPPIAIMKNCAAVAVCYCNGAVGRRVLK